MKAGSCRSILERHKPDYERLWMTKVPEANRSLQTVCAFVNRRYNLLYIVLSIFYVGKLEVGAEAFDFGQRMDGLLVVDFAQLQEMQFQAVAEEQSALAIAYLKDIVAVFERGEESAFCDRDDYAFLHSIIVFADLQCRIDESAAPSFSPRYQT